MTDVRRSNRCSDDTPNVCSRASSRVLRCLLQSSRLWVSPFHTVWTPSIFASHVADSATSRAATPVSADPIFKSMYQNSEMISHIHFASCFGPTRACLTQAFSNANPSTSLNVLPSRRVSIDSVIDCSRYMLLFRDLFTLPVCAQQRSTIVPRSPTRSP